MMSGVPRATTFNRHKLTAVRRRHRLSQRKFADLIGCSASAITQLESGRMRPSLETLEAVARTCRVDIREFFGR